MKKWIVGALVASLIPGGAWYLVSPSMAMSGLKTAALAGDKQELKDRVNFPALRGSLKDQFRAVMVAEMAKQKDDNPFGALGMALASAMVDPLIDAVISPEGIKAMVENGRMRGPNDAAANPKDEVEWSIERKGFDRFIARPETDNPKAPSLVFARDGLGWDLVDIEIPGEADQANAGA